MSARCAPLPTHPPARTVSCVGAAPPRPRPDRSWSRPRRTRGAPGRPSIASASGRGATSARRSARKRCGGAARRGSRVPPDRRRGARRCPARGAEAPAPRRTGRPEARHSGGGGELRTSPVRRPVRTAQRGRGRHSPPQQEIRGWVGGPSRPARCPSRPRHDRARSSEASRGRGAAPAGRGRIAAGSRRPRPASARGACGRGGSRSAATGGPSTRRKYPCGRCGRTAPA